MIEIIEDPKKWSEKYNIRPREGKCLKCGIEVVTDVPFAFKGYRGLKSKDHGCGEKYTRKVLVPTGREEKEKWANIARQI